MANSKHRAFRVTDEQDASIERIAALHGVSATDLFRAAMVFMGDRVGVQFPMNHRTVGSTLNQTPKKKKPAPKIKQGRAS